VVRGDQPDAGDALATETRRQGGWDVRFEWGVEGLRHVAEGAAAVVVVDVLRFTTAVSVAVGRGAAVLPYVWSAGDAPRAYAARHEAELAGLREHGGWSLSPTDLARITPGARLVLPSPNGSALSFGAQNDAPGATVLAGCLRNATAVAAVAGDQPGPVAVVAAGERWRGDLGPLRPAVEDLIGAGAVVAALVEGGHRKQDALSPDARAAAAAFEAARSDSLGEWLAGSGSGRELAARGWSDDVAAAATLDAEAVAPVLDGPAFRAVVPRGTGHLR
jgi:2-phosphosulfolactate phosphatase